jgi:hypothetical protein
MGGGGGAGSVGRRAMGERDGEGRWRRWICEKMGGEEMWEWEVAIRVRSPVGGSKIFDPAQICRAILFDGATARALDGGHVDVWIFFGGGDPCVFRFCLLIGSKYMSTNQAK